MQQQRRELASQPWILRGPIGRSTWFGVAAADLASVRVEYGEGASTVTVVGNGGFVVEVDPARDPLRLVALDTNGDEIASKAFR